MTTAVEIRCPVGPQRLLAKWVRSGERPVITEGNLIELVCGDCRRTERMEGRPVPLRVLHRFNVLGELVETAVVWPDEQDK